MKITTVGDRAQSVGDPVSKRPFDQEEDKTTNEQPEESIPVCVTEPRWPRRATYARPDSRATEHTPSRARAVDNSNLPTRSPTQPNIDPSTPSSHRRLLWAARHPHAKTTSMPSGTMVINTSRPPAPDVRIVSVRLLRRREVAAGWSDRRGRRALDPDLHLRQLPSRWMCVDV